MLSKPDGTLGWIVLLTNGIRRARINKRISVERAGDLYECSIVRNDGTWSDGSMCCDDSAFSETRDGAIGLAVKMIQAEVEETIRYAHQHASDRLQELYASLEVDVLFRTERLAVLEGKVRELQEANADCNVERVPMAPIEESIVRARRFRIAVDDVIAALCDDTGEKQK